VESLPLLAVAFHDVFEDPGIANGEGDFVGNEVKQQVIVVTERQSTRFVDHLQHSHRFFTRHKGNGDHVSRQDPGLRVEMPEEAWIALHVIDDL
jgi:hypothetical protein